MERLTRATVLASALAFALTAAPATAAEASGPVAPAIPSVSELGSEVVLRALSLLGVHYRFGGNTPDTGLDCSGLVRLVFRDALGLPLPRRSEEISRVGGSVAPTELQPGDLVFFNTLRRAFSHVGIYIGNNQFVHAPSTGGAIRVESLGADYWSRRFDGARRVLATDLSGAASFAPLAAGASRVAAVSAANAATDRRTSPGGGDPLADVVRVAMAGSATASPAGSPPPASLATAHVASVARSGTRRASPPSRPAAAAASRPAPFVRTAARAGDAPRRLVDPPIFVN